MLNETIQVNIYQEMMHIDCEYDINVLIYGYIIINEKSYYKKDLSSKDLGGGKWDISAAWHIDSWETVLQGAMRELYEELWLVKSKNDFHFTGIIQKSVNKPEKNRFDNEYDHIFFLAYEGDVDSLKMQEWEVDELKFVAYDRFKSDIKDDELSQQYVEHDKDYYNTLFGWLDKILS